MSAANCFATVGGSEDGAVALTRVASRRRSRGKSSPRRAGDHSGGAGCEDFFNSLFGNYARKEWR